MRAHAAALVAGGVPDGVAVDDRREALRVLVASLARGGAERIVLEWLGAERTRGRPVELAVLHRRRHEYRTPEGIAVVRRAGESVPDFVDSLARRWTGAQAAVSTHLVGDDLLARLWGRGIRTVPAIHNVREGWRNDPARWPPSGVPFAVACAEVVRSQALEAGCRVPVATLRHAPAPGRAATDPRERERIRDQWAIPPEAFVVVVVGALKAQKDPARAVNVLARLRARREAFLVLLGGALDTAGLEELDRVAGAAARLGVAHALRLPGFVDPVAPWLAASDALLNVSRHEGLSMATAEALAAGLPVVATDVGGQREIRHARLRLLPADAPDDAFARELAGLAVRATLAADPAPRYPRAWSLCGAWRPRRGPSVGTLLVTANLNAGGAQRSLVNLASTLAGRHRIAIAVCGESTQPDFARQLAGAGVECFRPASTADPFEVAESLVAHATQRGASCLCFWNADARVKLLVARFAPASLWLVDAIPGAHAYEELQSAAGLGDALAFGPQDYYRRLDVLVTKFRDARAPGSGRLETIPNGVALREPAGVPAAARFLVSGRIAPSKRLDKVLGAFGPVASRHPGARLEIFGQAEPRHRGHLESLLAMARGLPVAFRGADPCLRFLGEPFTAAVVLGTHQGCPNAILEAMSAGLPVIANASGGTAELVTDGVTGWLLPEDCTADALAQAMGEAAADAGRARRLGLAGRGHVARHHSLAAMALRYLSVFDPELPRTATLPRDARDDLPRLRPA
jgi:glycosyltransferase involved in cell wall biosynthesis